MGGGKGLFMLVGCPLAGLLILPVDAWRAITNNPQRERGHGVFGEAEVDAIGLKRCFFLVLTTIFQLFSVLCFFSFSVTPTNTKTHNELASIRRLVPHGRWSPLPGLHDRSPGRPGVGPDTRLRSKS